MALPDLNSLIKVSAAAMAARTWELRARGKAMPKPDTLARAALCWLPRMESTFQRIAPARSVSYVKIRLRRVLGLPGERSARENTLAAPWIVYGLLFNFQGTARPPKRGPGALICLGKLPVFCPGERGALLALPDLNSLIKVSAAADLN